MKNNNNKILVKKHFIFVTTTFSHNTPHVGNRHLTYNFDYVVMTRTLQKEAKRTKYIRRFFKPFGKAFQIKLIPLFTRPTVKSLCDKVRNLMTDRKLYVAYMSIQSGVDEEKEMKLVCFLLTSIKKLKTSKRQNKNRVQIKSKEKTLFSWPVNKFRHKL